MGRKLSQPPVALPGKKFAPLNGRIRLSRVWGANSRLQGAPHTPPPATRHIKTVSSMNPFIDDTTKHHFLFRLFGAQLFRAQLFDAHPRGAHLFPIPRPAPTSGRFCPLPVPSGRSSHRPSAGRNPVSALPAVRRESPSRRSRCTSPTRIPGTAPPSAR